MTSYDDIEVGRELDKLIAEKVFGVKRVFRPCDVKTVGGDLYGGGEDYHYIPSGKPPRTHMIDARPVPHFSTNIAAAWQVVEKLRQEGWIVRVQEMPDGTPIHRRALCHLYPNPVLWEKRGTGTREVTAFGDDAALAVCRAALKSLEPHS